MERILTVILHDIRSSQNVGSIFRTADAAGVSKMYLTGYTPGPKDRFGRINTEFAKTSLGAEAYVPWEAKADIFALITELKKKGVRVIAVEQSARAVPYMELRAPASVAFIFGNEVTGIPEEVLAQCDAAIEIPMHGKKESLNVSVAAGIILFRARENLTINT